MKIKSVSKVLGLLTISLSLYASQPNKSEIDNSSTRKDIGRTWLMVAPQPIPSVKGKEKVDDEDLISNSAIPQNQNSHDSPVGSDDEDGVPISPSNNSFAFNVLEQLKENKYTTKRLINREMMSIMKRIDEIEQEKTGNPEIETLEESALLKKAEELQIMLEDSESNSCSGYVQAIPLPEDEIYQGWEVIPEDPYREFSAESLAKKIQALKDLTADAERKYAALTGDQSILVPLEMVTFQAPEFVSPYTAMAQSLPLNPRVKQVIVNFTEYKKWSTESKILAVGIGCLFPVVGIAELGIVSQDYMIEKMLTFADKHYSKKLVLQPLNKQ